MSGNTFRYNLILPLYLYHKVVDISQERGTTVAEFLRMSVKLILVILEAMKVPDTKLILRTGKQEKEIVIL